MPTDDTLAPLLAAALEGDRVATEELVRRTQPAVWRVCMALGSNGDEADLVQETYLRALRALPSFRGEAPVEVWLASFARRVCADDVRRRQRRRRLSDRLTSSTDVRHAAAPQHVSDLVDALSPDRRDAFVLTQYVGMSYEEAAFVLDCAIGTIRSRVARARADLEVMIEAAEAR